MKSTMDVGLLGESGWIGYCKKIAQGGGSDGTRARMMLLIGGSRPSETRKRIDSALVDGKITEAEFRLRVKALEDVKEMWAHGIMTHEVATPENDWHKLSGGGHMRKTHNYSQNW